MKKLSIIFFLLLSVSSCLVDQEPIPTSTTTALVSQGDVVVLSYNTDSVVVFNSSGTLKSVIYTLATSADNVDGIAWLASTNEILLSINGTPDRIEALSVITGATRNFYNNITYFTGTPLGIVQLRTSEDVIVSEGATIERFTSAGVREVFGAIWPTSVHANATQIVSLSTGNWLSCSSSAGLRIYPDSTTALAAVATVTGPVGALASYGCGELSNGAIVSAWNGAAADYIYSYSATLTGATAIINNVQSTLSDPRGVAIGENDEIYISDNTQNKVVQIDSTGTVVRQFGTGILNGPRHIFVVPAFTP